MPTAPISLGRLLRLAGPLVAAQVAFLGMHTTDTLIAGRLGAEALAAVAVGNAVMMSGFVTFMGFCMAVSPGVAQRHGAGTQIAELRSFMLAGGSLAVLLWTLWGALLWTLPPWILPWLQLEPAVAAQATGYMRAVALGTPALGLFFAGRNLLEGLGYSRPIMWLGIMALLLNIPLDFAFMLGWGPFPALGATGCGVATALVDWALALAVLITVYRDPRFRAYAPRRADRLRRVDLVELLQVGSPIAAALFFEHLIFALGGLLMARFSTEAIAAHQITLNFVAMMFMVPIGLAQATSVLVGQAVGRRVGPDARRAGWLGYQAVAAFAVLMAIPMLVMPEAILRLYTDDTTVIPLGVVLLRVAGAMHLFDALQALGAGALRGYKDTSMILLITLLAYWGVGFPVCLWLAFAQSWGPSGIWWGFSAGLAVAALLLAWRFQRISLRPLVPIGVAAHVGD